MSVLKYYDKEKKKWEPVNSSDRVVGGGGTQVQSDWNQNDSSKPDYVKNRVCYTKDPVESEWLPETVVPISEHGNGLVQGFAKPIKPLTKYRVIVDSQTYEFISQYIQDASTWVIGNVTPEGNPAPPIVLLVRPEGLVIMIFSENPIAQITISVQEIYEEPVKLPEKYLPDKILSPVGRATPQGGEIFNDYVSNVASGVFTHAEGERTTASGVFTHAEGERTTASGRSSHAEGFKTTVSGNYSHAEGFWTTASGEASHVEGDSTAASSDYQHVQGKYNIDDAADKYAHIVGNGSSGANSNAHTLDWEGNSWYQGSVLVAGTNMDAPDAELNSNSVVIKSSTPGSAKRFRITVDDTGAIKATEIV